MNQNLNALEPIPLSLLNDFLYCRRRAALKEIEGTRSANKHTVLGDLAHEHADLPGFETAKGVTLLRALPVWSERLGLSGKCDIVESHPNVGLVPVEYKKSKRRHFENDDVQLCAQALCLEEMFSRPVPQGAVFHAASKRRREVEFTKELRAATEAAIAELRWMIAEGKVPTANYIEDRCEECSLFEVCLPRVTSRPASLERVAAKLFEAS